MDKPAPARTQPGTTGFVQATAFRSSMAMLVGAAEQEALTVVAARLVQTRACPSVSTA